MALAVLLIRVPRLEAALSRALARLDLRRLEAAAVVRVGLLLAALVIVRSS